MAASTIEYEIKRTVTGKAKVYYLCPKCRAELNGTLSDAGASIQCPSCGSPHAVPGVAEREAAEEKKRAEDLRKMQAKQAREAEAAELRRLEYEAAKVARRQRPPEPRPVLDPHKSPTPGNIPSYGAIEFCAIVLRVVGWVCLIIGAVYFIVSMAVNEFAWTDAIISLGWGAVSIFYFAVAALLSAIRDMTINSWHTRMGVSALAPLLNRRADDDGD